jgi:hypothetical protein
MSELALAINRLGDELVQCRRGCAGIVHDEKQGILPRCLILERDGAAGRGCLVAGINPGRSKVAERAHYRVSGAAYRVVREYWHLAIADVPYYRHLRRLLDQLDFSGPTIWSDLAKCENAPEFHGLLPLQTLRACAGHFLHRELEATPADWPIFGVGGEAFKALAYLEPSRTVIGVPHPTGSRGQFFSLFDAGQLQSGVKQIVAAALQGATPTAVWLTSQPGGA